MSLFAQIQLHDHPSVFCVAEILSAIAAELSICLCHIYTENTAEDIFQPEKFLGGIRLAGALRPAEVLMQNFLSASKVFLDGRHKDIHIDRLCDMIVHSDIQCCLFIFGKSICRHGDDRDARLLGVIHPPYAFVFRRSGDR